MSILIIMNINQKFKNRRPKSVFRQKLPDQCSRFEIFSVTLRRHLWSGHRPQCYDSPIQFWATSLSKQRPLSPSVSEMDFILICKKLTKNKIGLPAFSNGSRGFVFSILPPQSFCSIWRKWCQCSSETK